VGQFPPGRQISTRGPLGNQKPSRVTVRQIPHATGTRRDPTLARPPTRFSGRTPPSRPRAIAPKQVGPERSRQGGGAPLEHPGPRDFLRHITSKVRELAPKRISQRTKHTSRLRCEPGARGESDDGTERNGWSQYPKRNRAHPRVGWQSRTPREEAAEGVGGRWGEVMWRTCTKRRGSQPLPSTGLSQLTQSCPQDSGQPLSSPDPYARSPWV
jgi:hypothetical protein